MPGGISGPPLAGRAVEIVGLVRRLGPPGLFVVGVGGVSDANGAWALLQAGADVVQVYTAFIYQGPGLVSAIERGLLSLLREAGLPNIESVRQARQSTAKP